MFDEGIITWIGQRASEAKRLPRVLVARGELGGKKERNDDESIVVKRRAFFPLAKRGSPGEATKRETTVFGG